MRRSFLVLWVLVVCAGSTAQSAQPNLPTKEDVAKEMYERWAAYSAGNVDVLVRHGQDGFGFGWRGIKARSSAWSSTTSQDVAERGEEAFREPIRRWYDTMERFHSNFVELHTAVDGDIGLVWGVYVEDFKRKGQPAEIARVRTTHTLKFENGHWRTLLYHNDIEPFDEHGHYLTELTTSAAQPEAAQPAAQTPSPPATDLTPGSAPTPQDVEKEVRRRWDVINSRNLDAIAQQASSNSPYGFGWRTAAARTTGWGSVTAAGSAARGAEAFREPIRRNIIAMKGYHSTFQELHAAVEGEIGLAWGVYVEQFRSNDGPAETARVRFTYTLKKEGDRWRLLLYHNDIEPFDEHGRYLPRWTVASAQQGR